MTYAIVEIGARQYKVSKGDKIEVERLTLKKASAISFDKVLFLKEEKDKFHIGTPYVKGAKVDCQILKPDKLGEKYLAYKYKRRNDSHWSKGFRQHLTVLEVKDIQTPKSSS